MSSNIGHPIPASQHLEAIFQEILEHLVDTVRRRGTLELNRWQVYCLTTWWPASGRAPTPPLDVSRPLLAAEARVMLESCISLVLYSYRRDTDAFTKEAEAPIVWAPPPPSLTIAPGNGILAHVARCRQPYRTRMIHVDLRTQNSLDDAKRGMADVLYCNAGQPDGTSDIVAVSAPAAGLLDDLRPEAFLEIVARHVGARGTSPAEARRPQSISIAFGKEKSFPTALLHKLAGRPTAPLGRAAAVERAAEPASEAETAITIGNSMGIVLAAVRERSERSNGQREWEWTRTYKDFGPLRVARGVIRMRHLGSLFDSYRGAVHDEVDRWRESPAAHRIATVSVSRLPGMGAFDQDLHRLALRIGNDATAYGFIQAGFSGEPPEPTRRVITELEHALGPALAELIGSLRRWFRGTVAKAHLCWDLERSLLIRVGDHLAGSAKLDVQELETSLTRLYTMLADVEVDASEAENSPGNVIQRIQLAHILGEARELSGAVAVVPWLLRRGYRVMSDAQFRQGTQHDVAGDTLGPPSSPAIYVDHLAS